MRRRSLASEPHVPKYKRLVDELTRDIHSGRFQPGDRFPSEAALVQRYGASRITVGRALRELVQRGLVRRVAGSGTFVQQVRHGAAGFVFGLLIPELGETEIFEPICHGMSGSPRAKGCGFLWGHARVGADSRAAQALELCSQFIERRVAGVFFAPLEGGDANLTNQEISERLHHARIPVVLLDRSIEPYPQPCLYDLVGIDNRRAGYVAAEHLLKLGARRMAFIAHSDTASTVDLRRAGYREALESAGIAYDPSLVMMPESLAFSGFDSCVCANDRTAGEVMHTLLSRGCRIPEDIRIVGIDDVEYSSLLLVPLTTVRQPCREIGEAAVSAMLDRIARPNQPVRDVLLACRLVVRRSCGSQNPIV